MNNIAVCAWSLQPKDPVDLVDKLRLTGILRAQLALDPLRESPKVWGATERILRENGVSLVSGMVGCVGEDYGTLETIRVTGGVAPDDTWEQNKENFQAEAALAQEIGLKLVTFHAGFFPAEESGAAFAKMTRRLAEVADIFTAHDIVLGLETGQETAVELAHFLRALNHPTIGVNFDPANMILYDKGDPIEAVETLGPWIRQIHIKDAKRTKVPGVWGEEVPAGTGDVEWRTFFAALKKANGSLDLVIEREAGTERIADIQTARTMVEEIFG